MYKFKSILKTLVWGTESWVLSAVPGSESVVSEGPCAGRKITDLYEGRFPLLIKFIDARQDLSVQVHPDDELAAKRHNCPGKTEMWYIIKANEGAHLLSGLDRKITPDEYMRLVAEDRIVSVLADYKVSEGDVFFLPAGRIHAIGGGCYLAEIQETSDITYRIYDYGRLGLDGKPRQLHTELSRDAIDYTVLEDYRTHYVHKPNSIQNLVSCSHFTTDLLELDRPFIRSLEDCGKFLVLIALDGEVQLRSGEQTLNLSHGECALIFSAEQSSVEIQPLAQQVKLLETYIR